MRKPRILTTLLAVTALVVGVVVPAASASAMATVSASSAVAASGSGVAARDIRTTLAGFDPGNIISDAVFTDRNTMTEAQIQAFFNSKVSRCQGGADQYGPIICLKDFTITSVNRPADRYCQGYTGAPNETAARIIYRVAQSCGINPQVLIVMLQKEQGLVTHTWPSIPRYNAALGQGCPDGGVPCDPSYVGFFHQIYGAARQMQIYMEGRYFTYYAPGNTWNILFNPNRACGSSPVYVANKATSALYYYTPYQPNAAAMRAGYGEGDGCSAYGNRNFYNYFTDWFGSTQGTANNPFGNIELIEARPGEFAVSGWVADPNTTAPLSVHVYVGPVSVAVLADADRPDVAAAYPSTGSKHGFSARIPAFGPGQFNACVYAINAGPGANVLVGCKLLDAVSGPPVGRLDAVVGVEGGLEFSGWALDPDTTASISVHVYVDAQSWAITADRDRPDLAPHFPGWATTRGFGGKLPASPGVHNVCAYGINVGAGGHALLGCLQVTVPGTADLGRPPIGNFEALAVSGTTATASGWAIDPDTTAPIAVHLYVGSSSAAYAADKERADIAAFYPGYGPKHGFVEKLTLPVGTTNVCAYAINTGPGGHTFLGCRTATVKAPVVDRGLTPFGNFEAVVPVPGGAVVAGWAIDPDTTDPINVHIYVDASSAAYVAGLPRNDLAPFYPASGVNHGFGETIPMSPGVHNVCVYAINNGVGSHAFLGCRSVTVQ